MKQLLMITLVFLISASSAFATTVPADKMEAYKEAIRVALDENPGLTCTQVSSDGSTAKVFLSEDFIGIATHQIDVNNDGSQPLLTLQLENDITKGQLTLTTTPDFKKIIGANLKTWTFQKLGVNLKTGEISRGYVLDSVVTCVSAK